MNVRRWLAYRLTRVERRPDGRWHVTRPDWWGWSREHFGSWSGIEADKPEIAREQLDDWQEVQARAYRTGIDPPIQ